MRMGDVLLFHPCKWSCCVGFAKPSLSDALFVLSLFVVIPVAKRSLKSCDGDGSVGAIMVSVCR
jgi:hypothetical protein